MTNAVYTIGGRPFRGPNGQVYTTYVAEAPNGDTFGDVALLTPASGPRYFQITQASPMSAAYTGLRMNVYLTGKSPIPWDVPADVLAALKAGTGDIILGDEIAVLGAYSGAAVEGVRFVPRNASGDGSCPKPNFSQDVAIDAIAPSIDSVTVTGTGAVGATLTATPVNVSGSPIPTAAYQWTRDGADISGATSSTYLTTLSDSGKSVACRVTVTNSEGSVSATSAGMAIVAAGSAPTVTASISGNGYIGGEHVLSVVATGDPTPTVTQKVQMDGVDIPGQTGTTYTPTAGGTLSWEVTATNTNGSASTEPTKAISSVAALASADWTLFGALAATDVNLTARRISSIGILPSKNATRAWMSTDTPENLAVRPFPMGWVELVLDSSSGGWQRWNVPSAYSISAVAGATNTGNGIVAGGVSRSANASTITLTATSSTSFTVSGLASGTATVGTEFVSGDYRFTILAGTTAFASGDTFTLSISTWDFSVFDPSPPGTRTGDTTRQARVALCYAVSGGARSPKSADVKEVPNVPTTVDNKWYPFMGRSAAEKTAGIIGVKGKQNFKCVARSAANPARIWWGLDVNGPVKSDDSAAWYHSPPLRGMDIMESVISIWMDPQNASRALLAVSAADMRATNTTGNAYDRKAGLYLTTDDGETATLVLNLINMPSGGINGERDNRQLFVAKSGGTTTTRTIYYLHKPRPKGGAWGAGTLYRSTNGGTTWAAFGASITNATFGDKIYWIDIDPDDNLYLGCDNGLFKSTNGGTSWTACTGIGGPVIVVNAYHGGTDIWAAKRGDGAYQATNVEGTTFARNSALGAYTIRHIAVCPSNAQRILVAQATAGVRGKYSHNGGASWSFMVHRDSEGATNTFAAMWCHEVAIASWTPGSDSEVIFQLKQCFGKSTDGGQSTDVAGNGTDYQTRRGMGFDPGDWRRFVSGTQDTTTIYSDDGQWTEWPAGFASPGNTRDDIKKPEITGHDDVNGGAGLILRNGTYFAVLSMAGGDRNVRMPLKWTASGGNPIGRVDILNTSVTNVAEFSGYDWTDNSVGWQGTCRFKLSSGGVVSLDKANMDYEFYGASATSMRIFGGPAAPGDTKTIRVSANGGDTWLLWGTSPVRFAIPYGTPGAICPSRHSANRVYVGESFGGTGRVYRMEGATPTNTLLFTLADVAGFTAPATEIHRIRETSDPNIIYVLAYAAGNSIIFKISGATGSSPTVEDVSYNIALRAMSWLYVHPLTDDVIWGGQAGSRILRCHSGSTLTDAGKLYDRTKTYVDANLGVGVEL